MKRVLVLIAAVAAMAAFSACNKEDIIGNNVDTTGFHGSDDSGPVKAFMATTESVSVNGKISLVDTLPQWCDGDAISVYDAAGAQAVYTLTSGTGTANGVFSCSSSAVSATPYSAVYPADIRTAQSQIALPAIQQSADGSLQQLPMYAVGNTKDIKFFHLCGVLCIRLSATSPVNLASITIATSQNINGEATISGSGMSVALSTPTGTSTTTLSVSTPQSIASARDFYMYLPAGSYSTFNVTMTASDSTTCTRSIPSTISVQRGKITTISLTELSFGTSAPVGTINGLFTINAGGTQVHFSQGNLQYQASSDTWRFAEHQWDYVGNAAGNITVSDRKIQSGWIDLFGWGTSGWSGSGAVCWQPWSTSINYTDYYPGGAYTNNLTGAYARADWGINNAISNGGNITGQWRTLTKDEWVYVFDTRSASTVNGVSNARYAKGTVAGVTGVILFPDSYSHPSGVTLPTNINGSGSNYTDNSYTVSDWSAMEEAGAVFLPAAGYRNDTSVYDVGSYGYYYSSSCGNNGGVYFVYFYSGGLFPGNNGSRHFGYSVRLVRN